MYKRINVTLPEETVRLLDRVADKGDRSRFIDAAIKRYIDDVGRAELRKQLKAGALRDAEQDLELAAEWFPLDEEAWQKHRLRRASA
jgi:CopG family transcriptional regulator/antitoxin EndoAI